MRGVQVLDARSHVVGHHAVVQEMAAEPEQMVRHSFVARLAPTRVWPLSFVGVARLIEGEAVFRVVRVADGCSESYRLSVVIGRVTPGGLLIPAGHLCIVVPQAPCLLAVMAESDIEELGVNDARLNGSVVPLLPGEMRGVPLPGWAPMDPTTGARL